ncbi:MAG TPA: hypothetical protein PLY56_00065, partial [Armatimonadota bacterium]|nr:hypothetical protein [Armatimonadota bacterium]
MTMVRDGVSIGPFLLGSLVLHTFGFAAVAHLQGPPRKPPSARVIEVAVIQPEKAPAPKPAPAKTTLASDKPPRPSRSALPRPASPARRVSKTPIATRTSPRPKPSAPAARKQDAVSETVSRAAEPSPVPAGPRAVQMARRALPEAEFPEWRPRPNPPGSGTPAGPGSNRQEEAPGGGMAGPRRLSRARPEVSFPGDPLGETQALPGGTGRAAREPLPLGLPIGRRDAAGEPEPGLVSRQVGGGAPTPGSGDDPGGGSRAARAPETVTFRFGAGGMRLPKATPRIGGGGGTASVLATGPSTREADEVPVSPRPGVGPGQGGGAGAGIGGG